MLSIFALFALAQPVVPLNQTSWILIQLQPGQTLYTLPAQMQKPSLQISGNQVSGFTGCSQLQAKVKIQGQSIRFSQIDPGPDDQCPDRMIDLRGDFAALLENAQTYQIAGNRLTIRVAKGLLVFEAAQKPVSTFKTSDLLNKTFDLVSVNGKVIPEKHGPICLNFMENRINGSDGCNGFAGKYRLRGNELFLPDSLVGTQMGCIWMVKVPNLQVFLQQLPWLTLTGQTLTLETAQAHWVFETR